MVAINFFQEDNMQWKTALVTISKDTFLAKCMLTLEFYFS